MSLFFDLPLPSALEEFNINTQIIKFHKVIGYIKHQRSKADFGSFKSPFIPLRNSHEYKRLISDLFREVDENAYLAKFVQLHLRSYWTK